MKLFTHKLVIYDKGFKFEWEKKDPLEFNISIGDIVITVMFFVVLLNYL